MTHLKTDWKTLEIDNRRWPIASFDNKTHDFEHFCWRERRIRLIFENGWLLSIVWGSGTYSSNHLNNTYNIPFIEEPTVVELAAWNERLKGGMVTWPDGDTVEGYVPVEALPEIIDCISSMSSEYPEMAWVTCSWRA